MELLVVFLLVLNLITSLLLYRKLLEPKLPNIQYVFMEPVPPETDSPMEPIGTEILPPIVDNERYQAWRNVKEEPIKVSLPDHYQPPVPRSWPLERPSGFSS